MRGGGWGKKHSVVDYVFRYEPARLYVYHLLVMDEMMKRGFNPDGYWYSRLYRGKNRPLYTLLEAGTYVTDEPGAVVYPEHDDRYLLECLDNLAAKGAELVNGGSIAEMCVGLAAEKGV